MTRVVVAGYQDEIFIKMIHGTQQIYIFFLTFVNGLHFLCKAKLAKNWALFQIVKLENIFVFVCQSKRIRFS